MKAGLLMGSVEEEKRNGIYTKKSDEMDTVNGWVVLMGRIEGAGIKGMFKWEGCGKGGNEVGVLM